MSQPRFLLDEHVWGGLVNAGERLEADVIPVQSHLPEGADDEVVLSLAASQQRILLTSNTQHFAPLAQKWFQTGQEHWGILIVPGQTNESLLMRAIERILRDYSAESFKNTFRFITEFV